MQTWTMSSLSVNDAVTTSRDHDEDITVDWIHSWDIMEYSWQKVGYDPGWCHQTWWISGKNKTSRWDCPLPRLNILWFGAGASELVFIHVKFPQ